MQKNRAKAAAASPAEVVRCPWGGIDDPLYAHYHDTEWGVPLADDRALLEKLILEGMQAGLSWLTILKKRENFRRAFHNFDAERIARFTGRDVERLLQDTGIIRHRGKIEAAISNARAYLAIRERTSLAALLWGIAGDDASPAEPLHTMKDAPTQTPASRRMSKALKAAGFRFVGPTTVHAFMQSVGMRNDHLVTCHRHAPCAALQAAFVPPAH
ncbi:MAG: DNA-3-methyladenine glycosylase I [Hyphomicrobiaceae bacterium]